MSFLCIAKRRGCKPASMIEKPDRIAYMSDNPPATVAL